MNETRTPPPAPSPLAERGTMATKSLAITTAALTRDEMYDRVVANDAAFNGRFFLGVLTTGIYCLPSCRARKPKPDNVRFFDNPEEAREAGLRPCKR